MLRFDEYLQEFSSTVNIFEFLINLATAAVLALILRWFYIRFGSSISNRHRFALNFIPLALTTFLIITVVKSSLALSLGLVGALSIVRFRAAIKDPEELTYLFLTIAIGLVTGANKPLLALLAMVCILPLIYFNQTVRHRSMRKGDKMFVNIEAVQPDMEAIKQILEAHFQYVELKRLDQKEQQLYLSFVCDIPSLSELDAARKALSATTSSVSFVDKPDLVI